jgi:hypothetical protein
VSRLQSSLSLFDNLDKTDNFESFFIVDFCIAFHGESNFCIGLCRDFILVSHVSGGELIVFSVTVAVFFDNFDEADNFESYC